MRIFIIGTSRSGKTTMSSLIKDVLPDSKLIEASGWIKNRYDTKGMSKEEFIQDITIEAQRILRGAPDSCVDWITPKLSVGTDVIDGLRNMNDFVKLFNPTVDKIIHMKRLDNPQIPTNFDKGVSVISTYIDWMIDNTLLNQASVLEVPYTGYVTENASLMEEIGEFLKSCKY